jgi:SulP family sulfate permease
VTRSRNLAAYRREWLGNAYPDVLSGLIVAFALIPEAIGFSVIAGVDPKVGLYSSCIIPIVAAFLGGRTGMISAATGSMALLMTGLVKEHGLPYLFAATILAGIWQVVFGRLGLAQYLRFIPRGVMTGFVNALAILIFAAQLPQLVGASPPTYVLLAAGLAIIYVFPRITRAVPSPLVAIVVLTAIAVVLHVDVRRVGDIGMLPTSLPPFEIPLPPWTPETFRIIVPLSFTLALVGLIETLLTARLVDERTETRSDKNRECMSQGAGNVVTGFFGGMAGCAMIGQTMINISAGGRGRLSTFVAGAFLLVLMLLLHHVLFIVPMAALVAVMIVVAIGTFDWSSLRNITTYPKSETAVMLVTVAATLVTSDLSIGVLIGVLLSAVFFTRKVAQETTVSSTLDPRASHRTYAFHGQLFFVSMQDVVHAIDLTEPLARVTLDLRAAHIWDTSAVGAIDTIVLGFRKRGVTVDIVGMNAASATLVERVGLHGDRPGPRPPRRFLSSRGPRVIAAIVLAAGIISASWAAYARHQLHSLIAREDVPNPVAAPHVHDIRVSLTDPVRFERDVLDRRTLRIGRKPKVIIDPDGRGSVAGAELGTAGFALYRPHRPPDLITTFSNDGGAEDAAVADINGDGAPDIVVGGLGGLTYVLVDPLHTACHDPYRCRWTKRVIDSTHLSHDVRVADVNRDGAVDVVTEAGIYFNEDHGTRWVFRGRVSIPRDGEGTSVGVFERDGIPDIVAPYRSATMLARFVNPLHARGNPMRDPWKPQIIDRHPRFTGNMTTAIADLNGDGRNDIALAPMYGGGGLVWYEAPATPNGTWKRHLIDPTVNFVHQGSLRIADIDGNGHPDIVFAEQDQSPTRRIGIFYNLRGDGTRWELQVLSTEGGHNIKVGRIAHDRLPSILSARHGYFDDPNPLLLFRNRGA